MSHPKVFNDIIGRSAPGDVVPMPTTPPPHNFDLDAVPGGVGVAEEGETSGGRGGEGGGGGWGGGEEG